MTVSAYRSEDEVYLRTTENRGTVGATGGRESLTGAAGMGPGEKMLSKSVSVSSNISSRLFNPDPGFIIGGRTCSKTAY